MATAAEIATRYFEALGRQDLGSGDVARRLGLLARNGSPAQRRLAKLASSRTSPTNGEIAGVRIVELPGHARGLIGLVRASDRLALVSDTVDTLDSETGRRSAPRIPHPAFDQSTECASKSIRKRAALDARVVWTGHADPVRGDVAAGLHAAAAAPV